MNIAQDAIIVQKTAAGKWDVTINWACPTRELGDDLIVSSVWEAQGPDSALTLYDESISDDQKDTTVWIADGTLPGFYTVTNTVETLGERTLTGTFLVQIVPYVFLTQPRRI